MATEKSFPVKYMVVKSWWPKRYNIIDTSFGGNGKTVRKWIDNLASAHVVCKLLNQFDGYHYGR